MLSKEWRYCLLLSECTCYGEVAFFSVSKRYARPRKFVMMNLLNAIVTYRWHYLDLKDVCMRSSHMEEMSSWVSSDVLDWLKDILVTSFSTVLKGFSQVF